MSEENQENETPTNEEEQQPNAENESKEESNEELDKAKKDYESQKVRAEKAEKELKSLKAKAEKSETPKKEEKEEKSDEPDYAKIAFLNSNKIDNSDDQKLVMDEAERLKLPLTDILNMKHIKGQLKDAKDQREAEDGSPKGKGKSGTGQKDIDHHLAKGTTPDDLETATKVIEAREKKENSANEFSDELF